MNWDYDKLFAVGNIIGIKNKKLDYIFVHQIIADEHKDNDDEDYSWDAYQNEGLKSCYDNNFHIEYIIRLDEHGDVIEHLFDRDRDMSKPMPKLEAGMFGEVVWFDGRKFEKEHNSNKFVVIGNGTVIYENGEYDEFESLKEDITENDCGYIITKVYNTFCKRFAQCTNRQIIWTNTEYDEWVEE